MRDFFLRVSNPAELQDRGGVKHNLYQILDHRTDEQGNQSFFYSVDPTMDQGDLLRVRLLNEGMADKLLKAGAVETPVAQPSNGDEVLISVWVALAQRYTKRRPDGERLRQEAFENAGLRLTDVLEDGCFDLPHGHQLFKCSRRKDQFYRNAALIQATGKLRDAAALVELMKEGIGCSRAYGFGLVDVQIINS